MTARKPFAGWLATFPFEDRLALTSCDGRLLDVPGRMWSARDHFDSLIKLQTWAQERFPTWYTRRGGEANDGATGKEVMALLWASYLSWAEAD